MVSEYLIPAILPWQQRLLLGLSGSPHYVVWESPPYQPSRWRCKGCRKEQIVRDYTTAPPDFCRCPPPEPEGWIMVSELPAKPGAMSTCLALFCSRSCMALYTSGVL